MPFPDLITSDNLTSSFFGHPILHHSICINLETVLRWLLITRKLWTSRLSWLLHFSLSSITLQWVQTITLCDWGIMMYHPICGLRLLFTIHWLSKYNLYLWLAAVFQNYNNIVSQVLKLMRLHGTVKKFTVHISSNLLQQYASAWKLYIERWSK